MTFLRALPALALAPFVIVAGGDMADQVLGFASIQDLQRLPFPLGYDGPFDCTAHGATGTCTGLDGKSAGTLTLGQSFTDVPGGHGVDVILDLVGARGEGG